MLTVPSLVSTVQCLASLNVAHPEINLAPAAFSRCSTPLFSLVTNGEVHYEVDSAKDLRASLASAVYEKSGKLTEIRKESITLEEIFVKIVSGETGSVEESGDE